MFFNIIKKLFKTNKIIIVFLSLVSIIATIATSIATSTIDIKKNDNDHTPITTASFDENLTNMNAKSLFSEEADFLIGDLANNGAGGSIVYNGAREGYLLEGNFYSTNENNKSIAVGRKGVLTVTELDGLVYLDINTAKVLWTDSDNYIGSWRRSNSIINEIRYDEETGVFLIVASYTNYALKGNQLLVASFNEQTMQLTTQIVSIPVGFGDDNIKNYSYYLSKVKNTPNGSPSYVLYPVGYSTCAEKTSYWIKLSANGRFTTNQFDLMNNYQPNIASNLTQAAIFWLDNNTDTTLSWMLYNYWDDGQAWIQFYKNNNYLTSIRNTNYVSFTNGDENYFINNEQQINIKASTDNIFSFNQDGTITIYLFDIYNYRRSFILSVTIDPASGSISLHCIDCVTTLDLMIYGIKLVNNNSLIAICSSASGLPFTKIIKINGIDSLTDSYYDQPFSSEGLQSSLNAANNNLVNGRVDVYELAGDLYAATTEKNLVYTYDNINNRLWYFSSSGGNWLKIIDTWHEPRNSLKLAYNTHQYKDIVVNEPNIYVNDIQTTEALVKEILNDTNPLYPKSMVMSAFCQYSATTGYQDFVFANALTSPSYEDIYKGQYNNPEGLRILSGYIDGIFNTNHLPYPIKVSGFHVYDTQPTMITIDESLASSLGDYSTWTIQGLTEWFFSNRDVLFIDLPLDFDIDDIFNITFDKNTSHTVNISLRMKSIDNGILTNDGVFNFRIEVEPTSNNSPVDITQQFSSGMTVNGYAEILASSLSTSEISNILATNAREYLNTLPNSFNGNSILSFDHTFDNLSGRININDLKINNYYNSQGLIIDNATISDNAFVINNLTIDGFKVIEPTTVISNVVNVSDTTYGNYLPSEIIDNKNMVKQMLFNNHQQFLQSLPQSFYHNSFLDGYTIVANDKVGTITINNLMINNYYASNGEIIDNATNSNNALVINSLTINGFKTYSEYHQPTMLKSSFNGKIYVDQVIDIDNLQFAGDNSICSLLYNARNEFLQNLPTSFTINSFLIDSENRITKDAKNGLIQVNGLYLADYYNDSGVLISNASIDSGLSIGNITIQTKLPNSSKKSLNLALIIGLSVGGFILLLLIIAIIVMCCVAYRRKKMREYYEYLEASRRYPY